MLTVEIVEDIINSMTPLFNIKEIEDVTVTKWKLTTCKTYWLRAYREIEIDGSLYFIDEVVHNEYIVISPLDGALKPTVQSFNIYAPSFYFGTRNKVNTDRISDGNLDDEKGFDAITPFAFLLSRISEVDLNDDENPVKRNANIKIFFLEKYNLEDDTHNRNLFDSVIKQLHSMADYFIKTISDNEAKFNEPENIERRQYEAFSPDNTNSEWYFDSSLAGVELNLTIPILDIGCDTCKPPTPSVICAPVIVTINGETWETYKTGTVNDIIVKDTDGLEVGSKVGTEWIVPSASVEIIPQTIPLSGNTASQFLYDDVWRRDNGYYENDNNIGIVQQQIDFYTLKYDNPLGTKTRFIGLTGGYRVPKTASDYRDINGNVTTEDLAFPNNYIIDCLTHRGYYRTVLHHSNTASQQAVLCNNSTLAGYNDWFMANFRETDMLYDETLIYPLLLGTTSFFKRDGGESQLRSSTKGGTNKTWSIGFQGNRSKYLITHALSSGCCVQVRKHIF